MTDVKNAIILKPCPFCGSEKLKIMRRCTLVGFNGIDDRIENHKYYVRCNCCYARGVSVSSRVNVTRPSHADRATEDGLMATAAVMWNLRRNDE